MSQSAKAVQQSQGETSEGCRGVARRAKPVSKPFHQIRIYRLSRHRAKPGYEVCVYSRKPNCRTFYIGLTSDLRARIDKHNAGEVSHTSKHRPWFLKTYVAFSDEEQAVHFEKYLKSASGRAFAKKRL